MKKLILCLITGLFFNLTASPFYQSEGIDLNSINDGPYIYIENNELKVVWIENNKFYADFIIPENFPVMKKKFNLLCDYNDLSGTYLLTPKYKQSYNKVDSIGIITDIHGEFKTYVNLMKANGIIDDNLNWKFGRGHLVILGDMFDRGDKVTEVLWHIFGLEKQAAKAGGMVHVLLGNHEFMVFSKDLGYINEKYRKVEEIFNTNYFDLYSESTVLGKWLRSKPVMITINDIIFVHAGISMELLHRNLSVKQLNKIFSDKIFGKDLLEVNKDEELVFLNQDNGPVWYRGYFTDTSFSEIKLDSILTFYGKRHIVVGHTAFKGIQSLFNNKIFGADTGIMYGKSEEMLLYKNESFYRGSSKGKRSKL